ncbi:MAG: hypothetical protein IJC46_08075 [Clostridia bacterium]|nr:hypothetical protein [Clostridia bacterium]
MKHLFPAFLGVLLLLSGCGFAPQTTDEAFTPPNITTENRITPIDILPSEQQNDWFLFQDRIYQNLLGEDGHCYVISASIQNNGDAICLLKGGQIYGQVGSVLIAAGNGKLLALDLSKKPVQWTVLTTYDAEKMKFLYCFSNETTFTILSKTSNNPTVELLIIDVLTMTLTVQPRAISGMNSACFTNGTLYFTQQSDRGATLLKATPMLTQIETLATFESAGIYLTINQNLLFAYTRQLGVVPPSSGHAATIPLNQERLTWIFDIEKNQPMDISTWQEQADISFRYLYNDYCLTLDEDQWHVRGNDTEQTVPASKDRPIGFAANEYGIVFEQKGLSVLSWKHNDQTLTALRYSNKCIEQPLYTL